MAKLNLIEKCVLRLPGGCPVKDHVLPLKLSRKYKIGRLSFEFESPITVCKNSILEFKLKVLTPDLVMADILRGDIGFPEINLENSYGEVYRFKRGNLKDFLSIRSLEIEQTVRLPLAAFIYNIDLASNVKTKEGFWAYAIQKINFDFLSNSKGDIELEISSPFIVDSDFEEEIDIFDLLNFERLNCLRDSPIFLTESNSISVAITRKSILNKIQPSPLVFIWSVFKGDTEIKKSVELGESKIYIEIPCYLYGSNKLYVELVNSLGDTISKTVINIVKTKVRTKVGAGILGISDEFCFNQINNVGGKYRRMVFNLTQIIEDANSFKFSSNNDPFPYLDGSDLHGYIIALKGMPRWLSKSPDTNDFYRYGPSNMEKYKQLIAWLFKLLDERAAYAIESWNEANVIHEWNDEMSVLLEMQKICFDAASGLNVKLLSPSSTSWDFDFFDRLYELGIYNYAEGLAFHGYTYQPEEFASLFSRIEEFTRKASNNRVDFKAYLTEIGFRTPTFTEYEQALYLALFTIGAYFSESVSSIVWFRYRNSVAESIASYNQNASAGYAMVGYRDVYVRPLLATYRFLDFFLAQSRPLTFAVSSGVAFFTATKNGYKLYISYSESKMHNIELSKGDLVFDLYGNSLSNSCCKKQELIFVLRSMSEVL